MKKQIAYVMSVFICTSLAIACNEEDPSPPIQSPSDEIPSVPTQVLIGDNEEEFLKSIVPSSSTFSNAVYVFNSSSDIQSLCPTLNMEECIWDLEHYTYLAGIVYLPHTGIQFLSDILVKSEPYWEYNIVFQDPSMGYNVIESYNFA